MQRKRLAAQITTQWVTLVQNSFQCWKRARKGKNPLQESQSENYNSTAPSGESSGAITFANQMHRTTLLNSRCSRLEKL